MDPKVAFFNLHVTTSYNTNFAIPKYTTVYYANDTVLLFGVVEGMNRRVIHK